ncbi:hypothetical protein KM1_020690 [Entamoeba histolytica HM-3:IMSS]|uniref:Xenotropic and polytropic murine leukemia virus receptor xpr1, putative n=2 Tax=Entamoeba histolytica TaxID=5759 RepID=M2S6S6_ENTHI|nr:xenotropic and polytropic murine leukemia virus receptor xpr1, putative [Entamoeba histolytica KU27]EMS17595.1 hypothetical protein KM1_020690 [Entamoeba histolytica HM-3:IMSS]
MKFAQKFNEGMTVEWEDQYVDYNLLCRKLNSIQTLKNQLGDMQHEVEDIVIEMSDESNSAKEDNSTEPQSPGGQFCEEGGEGDYTMLTTKIATEEQNFWKEFDFNIEKIDVFYCDRLKESCRFINDFYDRLMAFGLVDPKQHKKEKFQPIYKQLVAHEKKGIKKVLKYNNGDSENSRENKRNQRKSLKIAASMFQETEEVGGSLDVIDLAASTLKHARSRRGTISREGSFNSSDSKKKGSSTISSEEDSTDSTVKTNEGSEEGGNSDNNEGICEEDLLDLEKEHSEISRRKRNKLRTAAEEYYRGLLLMQNFCSLNNEAIIKILKKSDKITGYDRMETIKDEILESTKFYKMVELKILIEETEKLFQDAFHETNRLNQFKINSQDINPMRYWRIGVLFGGTIYVIILLIIKIISYYRSIKQSDDQLLNTLSIKKLTEKEIISIINMTRAFLLFSLLQIYWGIDMYIYRRVRINYPFIFDMQKRKYNYIHAIESGITQILLTTTCLYCMMVCLSPPYGFEFLNNIPYWIFPLINVLILTIVFIIKQIRHSWVIKVIFRIISAPWKKVYFKDFWMADQMTSISPFFSDYIFCITFFIVGWITNNDSNSEFGGVKMLDYTKFINPIFSCIPPMFRFLQCFRSARDSGNMYQLANAGKYFVSICNGIGGGIRSLYKTVTVPIYIFINLCNSIYSGTWDILMDWGLMRKKYNFLRKKTLYYKWIYPIAIAIDITLRFGWTINIILLYVNWFDENKIVKECIVVVISIIEVTRRGIWNVFRVEFEMTNNMDKFRATKEIPLPVPD